MTQNPIFSKDWKYIYRSIHLPVCIMLVNGILTIYVLINIYGFYMNTYFAGEFKYREFLGSYYMAAIMLPVMILVITPIVTYYLLKLERDKNTLYLLLSTQLKSRDIILGKFFASSAVMALIAFSSLPALATVFLLGGVSFIQAGFYILSEMIITVTAAGIGIMTEIFFKRAIISLCSYILIVGGVVFGGIFLTFSLSIPDSIKILLIMALLLVILFLSLFASCKRLENYNQVTL